MVATMVSAGLQVFVLGFAAVGVATIVLAALIARPVRQPPELTSVSKTARAVDRSAMPAIDRFHARDGTELAYRHYPARSPAAGRIAVVVHGSSGSSIDVHALAKTLAERGIETYAPDIRGHGASGTRGDIGYLGQLEDDLSDFVGEIRKANASAPLTLIGHSSGGGFALRVAGSRIQKLFARTVLLAPYLGYTAPTNQPNSGGCASADIPRALALMALQAIGIDYCEALPTLAFAVSPNSAQVLVPACSFRLMRNFATSDFRADFAAATRPLTTYSGADDELMLAGRYAEAVRDFPHVDVRLVEGVNHMGIVSVQNPVKLLADDIATRWGNEGGACPLI